MKDFNALILPVKHLIEGTEGKLQTDKNIKKMNPEKKCYETDDYPFIKTKRNVKKYSFILNKSDWFK